MSLRNDLLDEIVEERLRQIQLEHGGDTDKFDQTNSMNDWVSYIVAYAGRASAKVFRNQIEDGLSNRKRDDSTRFRDNMVKVASLALAALESYEEGNLT